MLKASAEEQQHPKGLALSAVYEGFFYDQIYLLPPTQQEAENLLRMFFRFRFTVLQSVLPTFIII